jgi:hypothetical protein
MKLILVRGGDKEAPAIAAASGWLYGLREDYTAYSDEIYMIDLIWENYDWSKYVEKIKQYKPFMAMVADYLAPSQRGLMYEQIAELRPLVERVAVCPKFLGAVAHIPSDCIVAVSVDSTYAGFEPPAEEMKDRQYHLLGGNPARHADLIRKYNAVKAEIISIDMSYHVRVSYKGRWFSGGRWVQSRSKRSSNAELAIASGQNLAAWYPCISSESWASLF